jgi:hypothetical protein
VDVMHDIWRTTEMGSTILILEVDYRQVQAPQDNDAAKRAGDFCLQVLARQLSSHRVFIARVKLQRITAQICKLSWDFPFPTSGRLLLALLAKVRHAGGQFSVLAGQE